jgi:hypothetical protein
VNFAELSQSLLDTIRTGDIGVPVALRVTSQFGNRSVSVIDGAVAATQLAVAAFSEEKPKRLHARAAADDFQLTLLVEYPLGQTFFLTTTAIDGARSAIDLLLIGNHGIVRLEGGELFDPVEGPAPGRGEEWKAAIESSLRSNQAVDFGI